jgi:hypothetical protein
VKQQFQEGDVMSERVVKGLVRLGVIAVLVAVAGDQAWAGTCTYPGCLAGYLSSTGGSACCRCYKFGSVELEVTATIPGSVCDGDGSCGENRVTILGTENTDSNPYCTNEGTDVWDTTCASTWIMACENHGGQHNEKNFVVHNLVGTFSDEGTFLYWDKKGHTSLNLSVSPGTFECKQPNWEPIGTPQPYTFKGVAETCPGATATTATQGFPAKKCCANAVLYGNWKGQPYTDVRICTNPDPTLVGSNVVQRANCGPAYVCGGYSDRECPGFCGGTDEPPCPLGN